MFAESLLLFVNHLAEEEGEDIDPDKHEQPNAEERLERSANSFVRLKPRGQ